MAAALGPKHITAHDDTKEFIRGLEVSARKVLTNANRKRMQELKRQQSLARRQGANPEADPPRKFVIEVPPGAEDWGDQLGSKTMEVAPTGMVVGVRATRRPSRHCPIDNGESTASGFPQLGESVVNTADGGDAGRKPGMAGRKLPKITRRAGGLTLSTPASGQTPGDSGDGKTAGGSKKTVRAGVPATKIDGRLTESPLFSASMMELTKPQRAAHPDDDDSLSGVNGGGEDEEEAGGIANMRVVNASKVIGNGRSAGKGQMATRKPKGKGAAETEGQGVTSWSSDDLRVKYRAEREREEAYQAFRLEEQVAEALDKDYGQVVAVPEVDRHPLYVAYYTQLERENTRCLLRASARNKMKRFITDVHTVWLTNLSHHPEFRRMVRGAAANQEHGGVSVGGGGDGGSNGRGDQTETATPRTATSRRGLDGGRDSAAIATSQSQIQSVQPERAFRAAFFFSSDSKDSSSPQPAGENTRQGDEQRRGGQLTAHTTLSYDDNEGGEPPELPPPPFTPPTLAVLVAERRQLAAVSTSGIGRTRRSLGSGPRRRSVAGGGGSGAGVEEMGSWLDMSARVLRVLRFVPPPPVSKSAGNAAEEEGKGDGAPLSPHGVGETSMSSPGATWMISSFHPYDGTETRVTIADGAVTKAVGEALSASRPLAMAGPSNAGGTQAGAGDGRAAASSGISASAPGGREEEGARLLVSRRGVRIPVLGQGGGVVGKVLSVVEVFASSSPPPQSGMPGRPGSPVSLAGRGDGRNGGSGGGEADDAARLAEMAAHNVILEVAAYPAGLFSPPETGEREHLQRNPRAEGRRRVVLTAESLWKRRRSMHPKVFLSEKPPLKLSGWLERDSRDAHAPSGTGAPDQAGNAEGAVEEGAENGKAGAEGSVGDGREAGDVGERGMGRKAQEDALDDLVNMVAFGPVDDREGRPKGLFSTDSPLLLRPAQSFGPEGTRAPAAAAAVVRAPSAGAMVQGSSAAASAVPEGGSNTALLAEESSAEVLLSLVRLGGTGRGRVPAIAVDGIPSDLIMPDDDENSLAQAWEEEADRVEPLSIRVSGQGGHTREVPGTCNIGKIGVTFDYPQASERTRAVASFFRDASVSSSGSVMVVVALALDTPRLTPLVTAWERAPFEPEAAPDEDVLDVVPRVMILPGTVLREGVVSELGGTVAPDAFILTNAERTTDYVLPEPPLANGSGGAAAAATKALASQELSRYLRHRRDWEEMDEKGFRRHAVYRLLEPDGHMQPLGFGVTKRAALPNTAAVCGRSTFHSEQRCTEQLCRQRTTKDYAYVSANDEHRGPSDPGSYSVSCKNERMTALLRTGLERYNAEMARVAVERERQAKDAALQAKVEIGKAQLANRRAREDAAARSLARKTDAQHLKISASADRIRRKWELRLQDSHVLEVRGCWEQRKDLGGSVFYRCTSEEGLPEPFSWDPPECWDVLDPAVLALTEAAAADGISIGDGSGSGVEGGSNDPEGPLTEELSSLRLLGIDPDHPQGCGGANGNNNADDDLMTPRPLNEDEKLSLAVDRLAGNEKLLGALAWRLGIPLADVRPDGREPPLTRDRGEDEEELDANREQIELGEHDDASDSDGERGDNRGPPGPLPQDHSDLRRMRVAERRRNAQAGAGYGHKQPKRQSIVPKLPLAEAPHDGRAAGLESQVGGLGWRRLARADLGQKFLERVVNPRMQGPRPEAVNTRPKPRPTSTTDPSEATKRPEDWSVPVEVMFIADVVEEHARVLHEAERRMKKEELLDDSSSGPFDAAKFAAHGPQEFTSVERRMMVLAEDDGRSKEEVEEAENKAKAVIAAKTGNLSELEGLLYENVPPDTKDSNGNSLLLLAAQQANKRMMKFLLRKGATMNVQNLDGNTVLHFCYSHGRQDLADYLKGKGADDSLLNSEGLTCYEGLQAERVASI